MEIIHSLKRLVTLQKNGCVATIGNFDGVHLGHQAVFTELSKQAEKFNVPSVVITFEPQPQEFFAKNKSPARLTKLREKIAVLSKLPIDYLLYLTFNQLIANLKAKDFIQKILLENLNIRHLIVGDDFHFGENREGNFTTLQMAGKKFNFTVADTLTLNLNNERISSTRIRQALNKGNLNLATKLLGRSYSMCGRIAHGNKIGRTIGFPTANVYLNRLKSPLNGVFAVYMHRLKKNPIAGIANLGTRPTLDKDKKSLLLEVHLFDFDENIYGHYVEVQFIKKLRSEQKFASFDDLKTQIKQDIKQARTCLVI
jgi:riboflavin kinase/FMN adenylyltransferase